MIHYNSGHTTGECNIKYDDTLGTAKKLKSGSVEFTPFSHIANTGKERLLFNGFSYKGEEFAGWRMRIKEHNIWYWILADGTYHPVSSYNEEQGCSYRKFVDGEVIPLFENREIESVVVEAMWRKNRGSGIKNADASGRVHFKRHSEAVRYRKEAGKAENESAAK